VGISADGRTKAKFPVIVKAPNKATSVLVECFLYAIVVSQTAIAAFAYKPIMRAAQIWPANIACFAISYFSIFALAFVQLHRIHRDRKKARVVAAPAAKLLRSAPSTATPVIVTAPPVVEPVFQPGEPVTALVPLRPQIAVKEEPVEAAEVAGDAVAASPDGLAFGLTRVQLAVILFVFLAALKVFSWALANVVRR
jgi:hypothetical protein